MNPFILFANKETLLPKKCVCERCGELGHTKNECRKDFNEILNLEKKIKENSDFVIEKILEKDSHKRDQFGPYKGDNEEEESWENTIYCINCGEKGHLWTDCDKPKFFEKELVN
jgi:hypothetical protein